MWNLSGCGGIGVVGRRLEKLITIAAEHEVQMLLDEAEPHNGKQPRAGRKFAAFSAREKAYAIVEVVRCLTTDCPPPNLNQWNESTVDGIFEIIRELVEVEIDEDRLDLVEANDEFRHYWRQIVAEAVAECDADEESVDPESLSVEYWSQLIEGLADTILWDADWDETIPASALRSMRVPDGYYSTPLPEVTDERLGIAKEFIKVVAKFF
jgi:hypothetical protein